MSFLDFDEMVDITVKIIGPPSQSFRVNLNIDYNLSDIRQELKKHIKNIDLRTLAFVKKFSETSSDIVNEEDFFLHEVIENNILYLGKNAVPNKPDWSYLNEKCKFNYGRFIT